jgi:hypothetical protein
VIVTTGWACGDTLEDVREPALLEMLGTERTREIGTQYRAKVPAEKTVAALRAAILGSQRRWHWGKSLEAMAHDDFTDGRVVMVGGWILSVTEARQCALYSLSA